MIKPQYWVAFPFRNGVAIVGNKRGKRGLINLRNERVIDIIYDKVTWLNKEDSAIVACSSGSVNSWYLYNIHGEKIVEYAFKGFKRVGDNYIFVSSVEEKFGIISSDGSILIKPLYDKITSKDDEKFVLQYGGRTKTISLDVNSWKTVVISKLSPDKFVAEDMLFQGVVDNNGNTILPFEYSKIEKISERHIIVEKKQGRWKYYGLLDFNLNEVMPLQLESLTFLQNGYIIRKGTLFNSDLSIILDGYRSIAHCPDGKLILCQQKKQGWYKYIDQYGLADENGKILFPCIASVLKKDKEGNVKFSIQSLGNGKCIKSCFGVYALFSKEDKILSNQEYSGMKQLHNGNLLVKHKGKTGIIDTEGNEIIECKYDNLDLKENGDVKTTTIPVDSFCNIIYSIDKYALADNNGVCLTGYAYNEIEFLTEGVYTAKSDSGSLLLDKKGKTIFKSTGINIFRALDDKTILIGNYNNCGVINKDGVIIVPCEYTDVELLPNGNLKVTKRDWDGNLYGLYSADGNALADCIYRVLETDEKGEVCPVFSPINDDFSSACKFDKLALANKSKELLTDFLYESLAVFDDHYFVVGMNGRKGLIDRDGCLVLSMTNYDIVSCISKDRFLVSRYVNKGIVDSTGTVIVPVEFSNVVGLPNNTWKVEKKQYQYVNQLTYGIYGDDGRIIYECKYKELNTDVGGNVVPTFTGVEDKLFRSRLLDKYALCSNDRTILTDYQYDDIIYAGDDYLIVVSDKKHGVVDYQGNIILPICGLVIERVVDNNHWQLYSI